MIRRRVLLQSLASLTAWRSTSRLAAAQLLSGGLDRARLLTLASAVLPHEIGADGQAAAVDHFLRWLNDYRPGAERDHGYGVTALRVMPPAPSRQYASQLDALDRQAGGSLAAASGADRAHVVAAAIEAAGVRDLPGRPSGAHVATDLMSLYFNSPAANDLAYRRAIGRDACRNLSGSDARPTPATRGACVMARHETDVCIIGGGISAALLAWKLSERRPGTSILIVEAGDRAFDAEARWANRKRMLDYGENAWPGDHIPDQTGEGVISRSMVVGGSAMHWGGVTNRFSEEDTRLKSMFGLATDWPIAWADLERYYCEAERRLGVSGDPSPLAEDARSEPFPMKGMTLSWNLAQLKTWGEKSGIPFWGTPQAKNTQPYDGRGECRRCNTCEVCPTQARYAPDHTFRRLLESKAIILHDRTLVRRLAPSDGGGREPRIAVAHGIHRDRPDDPVEYHAKTFVVASGYAWSSHLLLLSTSSRFPNGLANSSGLVGKYMAGHAFIQTQIELDAEVYPGMNEQHSLISRQFFRADTSRPFVRHDLRMWESGVNRGPRLRDGAGQLLLGDAVMADWRSRTTRATARVRAYYDIHPDRGSDLTLDPATTNVYGDPMPKVVHRPDAASVARHDATVAHVRQVFERLAANHNGVMRPLNFGTYWDHSAGGCRMGTDAASSVTDSFGRTHDHENLFVVGSPTLPTAGCTNGTLTFSALTLRSADHIADAMGGVGPPARD